MDGLLYGAAVYQARTMLDINGEDLREMNRLLLEKVEELTLYLLQLEEQMNFLKTKKN